MMPYSPTRHHLEGTGVFVLPKVAVNPYETVGVWPDGTTVYWVEDEGLWVAVYDRELDTSPQTGVGWRSIRLPATWTRVADGTIAALATTLSLTALSGYTRYRLSLTLRGDGANMPMTLQLNGDTSANYHAQAVNATNAVVTGVSIVAATSLTVIPDNGTSGVSNMITLDLTVSHDDQASSPIAVQWDGGSTTTAATSSVRRSGSGMLNVAVASITAITLTWDTGASVAGGTYALDGSA